MSARLRAALAAGEVVLDGSVLVFGATRDHDISVFPVDRTSFVQPFKPDYDAILARGFQAGVAPDGLADTCLVYLPRAKSLAFQTIADATARASQQVVIDGQKTDGIDSVLKAIKAQTKLTGTYSKAHGKLAWLPPSPAVAQLAPEPLAQVNGFTVAPGVFSADGIDPGSAALVAALPKKIGKRVADFGAGWGYLSAHILRDPGVAHLDVVEADHRALDCARVNVPDERTTFHWADATTWRPSAPLDTVVMNPPFHTGRAARPDLGRAFIDNAARSLSRSGTLWLVANRHLPYEQVLDARFARVEWHLTGGGYKIVRAAHPKPGA